MRVFILLSLCINFAAPQLRAQDDALLETTWHLRYLSVDSNLSNAPVGIPFTLHFEENNDSFLATASAVENTFSAMANFVATDQFTFSEVAVSMVDCTTAPSCDYEQLYLYSFLTNDVLASKTFTYDVYTYSQGRKALLLEDANNNRAYYTNEPLEIDPALFQTWYVYQQNIDFEAPEEFTPNATRSVTINEDLTYLGTDGCVTYSGSLAYSEDFVTGFNLMVSNFSLNEDACAIGQGNMSYFHISGPYEQGEIYEDTNGLTLAINGGTGFGTFYTNNVLAVDDSPKLNITLYPNPTTGTIFINAPSTPILEVMITDVYGKIVLTKQNATFVGLSHLQSGIYFLKIKTEKGFHTEKVVKQ